MERSVRKEAVAAYKERKAVAGIYLLRCVPSGQVWVGQAPDIETVRNRVDFTLRFGGGTNAALAAAAKTHSVQDFGFEELERLEDQKTRYIRDALLKERAGFWRAKLGALPL